MQGPQSHSLHLDPASDPSCVTLGKRFNLSVPRLSYLQNGDALVACISQRSFEGWENPRGVLHRCCHSGKPVRARHCSLPALKLLLPLFFLDPYLNISDHFCIRQWAMVCIKQSTRHQASRADILGMLTQVHLSFRQTQPPSERVIQDAQRSPDFKSDEGCSSINSLSLLCWWQRLLYVFSLSFSREINFVACHWICLPKCSVEILFEINYHVNKDRYYILIWKHSIRNLFFFLFKKVNITSAIIQRIWTFGVNLCPNVPENLCQPWVILFFTLKMTVSCGCHTWSQIAAPRLGWSVSVHLQVPCGEPWCRVFMWGSLSYEWHELSEKNRARSLVNVLMLLNVIGMRK